MFNKINIIDIVVDHYKTLVSFNTERVKISDYFTFFLFPIIVAFFAYYFRIIISANSAAVITTAVTILAGLLFNLLVLVHTINSRNYIYTTRKDTDKFFMEIYANIAYSILISLFCLVPLVYLSFTDNTDIKTYSNYYKDILNYVSIIVVFLIVHLFLTLLMVLKRIHYLLGLEFNQRSNNHDSCDKNSSANSSSQME